MSIFDAFFNSRKNTDRGYGQALGDLEKTRQLTSPFYTQSLGTAGQANTALADALGLNGSAASQNAINNFRDMPGYQFALDRGQQAIDQSAVARGNLNSGSTLKALETFGQGIADQQYNSYLSNLSGLNSGGYAAGSALTGQSNQFGNLAIGQGQARDQANSQGLENLIGLGTTAIGLGAKGGFGNIFGPKRDRPYFGFH